MNDKEFSELQLRATIVPQQVRWPAPERLHWQRLHEAVNEARERVGKAYLLMDEIDGDADLSREDKYRGRNRVADQTIAEFEASKTLLRAREAVQIAAAKYSGPQHLSPDIAQVVDATMKAIEEAEHGWQKAINKIAERVGITKGPHSTARWQYQGLRDFAGRTRSSPP